MTTAVQNKEVRACRKLELRAAGEGEMPKIIGYAAVFNELSQQMFGFREKIAPGAFAESLSRGDDVRALFNHEDEYVLGRVSAGTLELEEDSVGLRYEITPPNVQWAKDLVTSIQRRDIAESSFGFITIDDEWSVDPNQGNLEIRTLKKVNLIDVSPVTFPAYPQTDVAVRKLQSLRDERARRDDEDLIRRAQMALA